MKALAWGKKNACGVIAMSIYGEERQKHPKKSIQVCFKCPKPVSRFKWRNKLIEKSSSERSINASGNEIEMEPLIICIGIKVLFSSELDVLYILNRGLLSHDSIKKAALDVTCSWFGRLKSVTLISKYSKILGN